MHSSANFRRRLIYLLNSVSGDAKYLKWFESSGGKEADCESQRKPSRELTCKQNDEKGIPHSCRSPLHQGLRRSSGCHADSEIRFLKRSMDGRGARGKLDCFPKSKLGQKQRGFFCL